MFSQVSMSAEPQTVEELRSGFRKLMGHFAVPDGVTRTPIEHAGRPAVLVEPHDIRRPGTLLYFHGGSFALGSPETAMPLTADLALRTGMRAISFDYRLAPEHPFPAGVNDCLAAYNALIEEGHDAGSIAVVGDSAGGGLSVTTALGALRNNLPVPGCVVGFSAGLDQTRSGASVTSKNGIDPFFTPEALTASGQRYMAGADPHSEMASPALYADMEGFPPLLLQVGTDELLLDDSVRLAERARDAEVDVVLDVTAQAPHVFQTYVDHLDEAVHALDRAALFITQHTSR